MLYGQQYSCKDADRSAAERKSVGPYTFMAFFQYIENNVKSWKKDKSSYTPYANMC